MERIAQLHSRLLITISIVLAALVLWGLGSFARGGVGRSYSAGLAIAQLLILAECGLGLILLAAGAAPVGLALHIVYGAVAALILPAIYLANRGRNSRWDALIYAVACLFLLGIAARAHQTGG